MAKEKVIVLADNFERATSMQINDFSDCTCTHFIMKNDAGEAICEIAVPPEALPEIIDRLALLAQRHGVLTKN